MKRKIGLALLVANMAATAMAVELESVNLEALGKMELPAVSVEGIKPAGDPLESSMAGRLRGLNKLYNLLSPGAEKDRVYNEISELAGRMEAAHDSRKHAVLQTTDGTKVALDYRLVVQANAITLADPVQLEVRNTAFTGKEYIVVVLMNFYPSPHYNGVEKVRNIVLKYAGGGRFIAQADRVVLRDAAGGLYRQEIGVVVDGKWLAVPASQSYYFKLTMGL